MTDHVQANIVQFYSNLEKFRVAGKYTDLRIECDDLHFRCHRVTLASASPFFDSIIHDTATFEGCEKVYCMSIESVSALTLESVLVFIYTGDVTVTNVNICDLFKASKIFGLTGIADRCLEFIKKNKMTVDATVTMFSIACQDKNETLIDILSQDIADQLRVFVRSDSFLEISFNDFKVVLDKLVSSSTESDDALLGAMYRWLFHQEEKLYWIDFDLLCEMVRSDGGPSTEVTRYIFSKFLSKSSQDVKLALGSGEKCNSDFTAMPRTTVVSSALATAKKLYLFIKYAEITPVKMFLIDEYGECESSGEVHLKDDSFWIQTIAVKDHLYSLEYVRRNSGGFHDQQSFYVSNSIKMDQSLTLNTPPIIFGDVVLCNGRNSNIYAYNQTLFQPTVRTDSRSSAIFDNEEISRGIYLYNAGLDIWLPVPAMKRRVEDACLTTYNDLLYLIGGSSDSGDSPTSAKVVQTYDCREGMWHVLPQNTHNDHVDANCCEYDGKIYVCGGRYQPTVVERYDPICGKWEILESEMPHQVQHHHLVSYNHRLWSLGNSSPNDDVLAVNKLRVQNYPFEFGIVESEFDEYNNKVEYIVKYIEWEDYYHITNYLEEISKVGVILGGIVF